MSCRSCGDNNLEVILDLGNHAWCNDFLKKENVGKEKKYPLILDYCHNCTLLQLTHTVPKETMFHEHDYVSGTTKTLKKHFLDLALENKEQFELKYNDLIVDIGGNDGTQLKMYDDAGLTNGINVESAHNIAKLSEDNGIETINEYFNEDLVKKAFPKNSVKLFNASGVFFHLEELHSVTRGIKWALQDDGVFVVQCMYAGAMVDGLNFDTIYHEHLCYYTLKSLENLLRPHGLTVFDAYYSDIHSGTMVAKVSHDYSDFEKTERYFKFQEKDNTYTIGKFKEFAKTIKKKQGTLKQLLKSLNSTGKKIYTYGSPAKGNTLLTYFEIDKNMVQKSVEVNPLKIGKYLPISHIPIVEESEDDLPDYYLLLAHNFADEIIERNKDLIREKNLKFIIPFPIINIIDKNSL